MIMTLIKAIVLFLRVKADDGVDVDEVEMYGDDGVNAIMCG